MSLGRSSGALRALRCVPRPAQSIRTSSSLASEAYTSGSRDSATHGTPTNLSAAEREALERELRVDHAGEIAANTIYQAQADVFGAMGDTKTRDMMIHMWSTEKKHLQVAEQLLSQHRVRPSALIPLWSIAGRVLGGATALMGPRAAMACTEAVETVIGEHYDDQLSHLSKLAASPEVSATTSLSPHPSLPLLSRVITEFRDDELEHLDTAVEHEAQQAPAHALLTAVVQGGCRIAIEVAKRV